MENWPPGCYVILNVGVAAVEANRGYSSRTKSTTHRTATKEKTIIILCNKDTTNSDIPTSNTMQQRKQQQQHAT